MTLTDNTAVITLWWIALALTIVAIVPLALYLLHRAWMAASEVRRFTEETLVAARGIRDHTAAIPALDSTLEATPPLVEKADAIRAAAAELERVLKERAA